MKNLVCRESVRETSDILDKAEMRKDDRRPRCHRNPRWSNCTQHPLNLRAKTPVPRICSTNRRPTSLLMRRRPTNGELTSSIALRGCSLRNFERFADASRKDFKTASKENAFEVSASIATSESANRSLRRESIRQAGLQ